MFCKNNVPIGFGDVLDLHMEQSCPIWIVHIKLRPCSNMNMWVVCTQVCAELNCACLDLIFPIRFKSIIFSGHPITKTIYFGLCGNRIPISIHDPLFL